MRFDATRIATLRFPDAGGWIDDFVEKIHTAEPERPAKLNPAIPERLERTLLKTLEKEPIQRHPNAGALAAEPDPVLVGFVP